MALGEPTPPSESDPYSWDQADQIPPETRKLWHEVASGIDKSQTVVWKNAVDSLDQALRYMNTSEEARQFTERYMRSVIGILVEQQPAKIGQIERSCVEDSLERAILIISEDLRIQQLRNGECQILDVLATIFNRKKTYYKGSKVNWNANLSGLPEVRMQMIERFRVEKGFSRLADYLLSRVSNPQFPSLDLLHQILSAIAEAVPNRTPGADAGANAKEMEDDAVLVAQAVMGFISSASDSTLKKQPYEALNTVRYDLQRIFDRLVSSRRKDVYDFYDFWRRLSLKLITSQSLPLKLFGWDQVTDLIEASAEHRPPPKSFEVSNAGCTFVNGIYSFAGATTPEGYTQPGVEISYERKIVDADDESVGKKLTLFRCTMRSQQKWWFLSEADEEQPGTDKDIDYYQHKSKQHEETEPPPRGWVTCRNSGIDPSPILKGRGLMVPVGEEQNTLEHQLAKWAIEEKIIELVLGDSMHREVVARSTPLIKFLASMCDRDDLDIKESDAVGRGTKYCLQTSHLLLAWRTCTSKADAAVSNEVYQLLVSILPSLNSSLAIPLLEAIQASLKAKTEKKDCLFEVAEFCSALASANSVEPKSGNSSNTAPVVPSLSEEVRAEVLKLLWAVLTHPDASWLKSYDNLKRYVKNELRVEPKGRIHRENFLESCTDALAKNAQQQVGGEARDEALALGMVKLTRFVLEACPKDQAPKDQAIQFVSKDSGALPSLLFSELTAYLKRRKNHSPALSRKGSSHSGVSSDPSFDHSSALSERLRILRYLFGLSDNVLMTTTQLSHLWDLCYSPRDREACMVFIADASSGGQNATNRTGAVSSPPALSTQQNHSTPGNWDDVLSSAFSDEVRAFAFEELFCSVSVNWDALGEGAYQSFQTMFNKLKMVQGTSMKFNGPALDALWRICLAAGSDAVASRAMKDLLGSYDATPNSVGWSDDNNVSSTDPMQTDAASDNFCNRVFDCLVEVKNGLEKGDPSSERSAERCLRILNAAAGQDGNGTRSMPQSSLSSLQFDGNLSETLKILPHGMRSQSCYRRIGIMAKRTAPQNQTAPVSSQQLSRGREEVSALKSPALGSNGTAASRQSSTVRFSLDIHPLETLASVKGKVATYCKCNVSSVKPISVSGRLAGTGTRSPGGDSSQMSLNVVPDDSLVDELGIVHGCEMVFVIAERQGQSNSPAAAITKANPKKISTLEMSDIFSHGPNGSADRLFDTLLSVLEVLPASFNKTVDTHKLVWDLLLAIPTNIGIAERVRNTAAIGKASSSTPDENAMVLESPLEQWSSLLDLNSFYHSVYVMQVIDALLQPAPEVLCGMPIEQKKVLEKAMQADAVSFRQDFIDSGGFDAVVRFFSLSGGISTDKKGKTRMGNAVALRILKCCMFGNNRFVRRNEQAESSSGLDGSGTQLLKSLSDAGGLLKSLTAMVVDDEGVSSTAISDVLKFLRLLLGSRHTTESFVSLPDGMAKKFLMTLLLWEGGPEASRTSSAINAASKIRRSTHDVILKFPLLASRSFPWLIGAMDGAVEVTSDASAEYFAVLKKLVQPQPKSSGKVANNHDDPSTMSSSPAEDIRASSTHLRDLGTAVCKKLASCPRPTNDGALIDFSTGVLCGCLKLLRALIENGGGRALEPGTILLATELHVARWSQQVGSSNQNILGMIKSSFDSGLSSADLTLIDLMGAIFDGFLSPGGSSSVVSICCDKESRQLGFDVVAAAARSCNGNDGYLMLVSRISKIIDSAAPYLRHRWGHNGGNDEGHTRSLRNSSKYSGLRNQGCTCYMNSVLQQLFMMPGLRKELCAAPIPACLRTSGGGMFVKGNELVGKKISLQWDSGVSYDAIVEGFDEKTSMHTIRYCPLQIATVGGSNHQQVQPEDIAKIPPEMPDEFFLSEGRPGKETGVFEVVRDGEAAESGEKSGEAKTGDNSKCGIKETIDEAASRHLLEECQRTFIHLDEGSRGRCFDPRALVEACSCLKLEFDVWQQNDASEFAMKFLDRLEISLKRWAPSNFKYLEQTFGLKQTKQKVCKECGLKTNREENLMSIDCQIRGKSDIHEALSTMCDVEFMEGDNKVFCDRCKKNTDTVLRTAISALPDMLILSLKRFDLDYNTFETVKLNSRCAFGQTLNMKQYTLEGVEALEQSSTDDKAGPSPMDTGEDGVDAAGNDALSAIPDDDYEYKLAGVLVHAGVAQGGHYYSFIRDRLPGADAESDKWYRFDDEDVTPFDPSSIEVECFGGKVKKETKWPNGQVHTVESEQFANALMLFYEKVKPIDRSDVPNDSKTSTEEKEADEPMDEKTEKTSGYDVFEPDVRRSNATHRWQTFLFDTEFQSFLKGLLGLCLLAKNENERMDLSAVTPSSAASSAGESQKPWRSPVVQMLLSFVFDILLYSAEKTSLDYWVSKLSSAMAIDIEIARSFVTLLAKKTEEASPNWLRTYLADCPEQDSRVAAVQIFCAAVKSCASDEDEQTSLNGWCQAWKEQISTQSPGAYLGAMPTKLQGALSSYEDVNAISQGSEATALGVIISFITALLEVAPRTWRYNAELCLFIRELSSLDKELGGNVLHEAMVETQIPARLICLVLRERAPAALKASFPGASVSIDAIDTQIRSETNTSSHLLPISGNQVMNASDLNSRGNQIGTPVPSDYLTLFEALGCLLRIVGVKQADLLENPSSQRARQNLMLTPSVANALSTVFQEACSSPIGMSQHDIEAYLQRVGLDSSTVPPQKIVDILAKYPTAEGSNELDGSNYLSREGFLAYYRDTAHSSDSRVRLDLHLFGFRPDLSRRPSDSRIISSGGRESFLHSAESVAFDIDHQIKESGSTSLGRLADLGLSTFQLFHFAYSTSEVLAEHILAATAIEQDTTHLLVSTLKALYCAPSGWNGNETFHAASMVLKVLAAIPDSRQQERISMIMQCNEKAVAHADHGAGLLMATKAAYGNRSTDYHSTDYHFSFERYLEVIKDLLKLKEVASWMTKHRSLWSWLERDLINMEEIPPQQVRGDIPARREGDNIPTATVDPLQSDSDMPCINDSEDDDDDDSRYDEKDTCDFRDGKVIVRGAGLAVVDGVYHPAGTFDRVGKYMREGVWKDRKETFSLFRCHVSDNTKRWYISIVPKNVQPGTNTDIDFYSAPVVEEQSQYPPSKGWTKAGEGADPPPIVEWTRLQQTQQGDVGDHGNQSWSVKRDEVVDDDGNPNDGSSGDRIYI